MGLEVLLEFSGGSYSTVLVHEPVTPPKPHSNHYFIPNPTPQHPDNSQHITSDGRNTNWQTWDVIIIEKVITKVAWVDRGCFDLCDVGVT